MNNYIIVILTLSSEHYVGDEDGIKANKWSTPYEPVFYTVSEIRGSQITARRTTDGRTVCRDASRFKLVNTVIDTTSEHEIGEEDTRLIVIQDGRETQPTVSQAQEESSISMNNSSTDGPPTEPQQPVSREQLLPEPQQPESREDQRSPTEPVHDKH